MICAFVPALHVGCLTRVGLADAFEFSPQRREQLLAEPRAWRRPESIPSTERAERSGGESAAGPDQRRH